MSLFVEEINCLHTIAYIIYNSMYRRAWPKADLNKIKHISFNKYNS